jgi:hypothetical protein
MVRSKSLITFIACVLVLAGFLSGLGLGVSVASAMECTKAAFDALNLNDATFGLAVTIDAGLTGQVPTPAPNCRVRGTIWPEITFEVRLPATWNGRFYQAGGGGTNGTVPNLNTPVSLSYAAAGTDSGHNATKDPGYIFAYEGPSDIASEGFYHVNPNAAQKEIDFAYRSYYETAILAKKIIKAYYGNDPTYSYWVGCSEGGREAQIMAQRFPEVFDGIIAGSPLLDFNGIWNVLYNYQAQAGAGALTTQQISQITAAAYAKCDGLDGVVDGIMDPSKCAVDPARDLCPIEDPNCFSPAQLATIERYYGGAYNSAGELLFAGWPWGINVQLPPGTGRPEGFMRYMAFDPPAGPSWVYPMLNIETDIPRMDAVLDLVNATNPDLSGLKQHGGKLIHYHGWADSTIGAYSDTMYYESVLDITGLKGTKDFYRLYMVPGMGHCGGGVNGNTSTIDWLTPLVSWVENGITPGTLIGSGKDASGNQRTRPICSYPEFVRYKGTGDINDASNFICVVPANVRIEPETLNLKAKGVFSAFITLPEDYAGGNWQILSITCNGVSAVKGSLSQQGDTFVAKFNRQDVVNTQEGDGIAFTATVTAERDGKEATFEGSDAVKVIK